MIIAVIILYAISVIYKFASLLVIVNGVQKYANLNNYHYVITTYDENGLAEKEECWFKDGVSKTVNTNFNEEENIENTIYIDYNTSYGYVKDALEQQEIDIEQYLNMNNGYQNGTQLYSKFPQELRDKNIINLFLECFSIKNVSIKLYDDYIILNIKDNVITIDRKDLLPRFKYIRKTDSKGYNLENYEISINSVKEI